MKDPQAVRQRLAALPSVNTILQNPAISDLCTRYSRSRVVAGVRGVLQDIRTRILEDSENTVIPEDLTGDILVQAIVEHVTAPPSRRFRSVINASGILFHEALGGTPLSEAVRSAMTDALGPVVHDAHDEDGEDRVAQYLRRITGADAALEVHAALAALWLAIDTFGHGREVIVSRAQLGANGPVCLPDLFDRCGTRIVEVGATNKTHLEDYRAAIRDETGAICVVRPSTYALRGFTQDVSVEDLVRLGTEADLPVVYDAGHATLTPVTRAGWRPAVAIRDVVEAGVAVTVVSGDGLVGGPACGLAMGQRESIDRMRRNPLYHILRVDPVTHVGLEATLQQYDAEASGLDQHPAGRMFTDDVEVVRVRAKRLLALCRTGLTDSAEFDLIETSAHLTSSRLPSEAFPSCAVTIRSYDCNTVTIVERFYHHSPAVLVKPADDQVVLDLRYIEDGQIDRIYQILQSVLKNTCAN